VETNCKKKKRDIKGAISIVLRGTTTSALHTLYISLLKLLLQGTTSALQLQTLLGIGSLNSRTRWYKRSNIHCSSTYKFEGAAFTKIEGFTVYHIYYHLLACYYNLDNRLSRIQHTQSRLESFVQQASLCSSK